MWGTVRINKVFKFKEWRFDKNIKTDERVECGNLERFI
jgi:hypothetical protein